MSKNSLTGRRAAVIGAGPNGLSAAVVLARAGLEVVVYEAAAEPGGATRSAPALGSDTIVDQGAGVHPFAVASPFWQSLGLERHGLDWILPDIPAAHLLDDHDAAMMYRSLERTAAELGADGRAWRILHRPLVQHWSELVDLTLGPLLRLPRHPVTAARFGLRALAPATVLGKALFQGPAARALFAGNAAHACAPLGYPLTSGFGALFGAAGHATGWPIARGGSAAISHALVAELVDHGGRVLTDAKITSLAQVQPADLVMFDLAPQATAKIIGSDLPNSVRDALNRWRHGTAFYKIDYLLDGPVPWRDPRVLRAGTIHIGGSLDEIAHAEDQAYRGQHPERPFVLAAQQSLFDPSRAPSGNQVLYAYAHVPNNSPLRFGRRIDAQIERFAPGFADRILHRVETSPAALERWNPNLVGGDVIGGSATGRQLLRPRPTLRPYHLGRPGLFLCSASTPPGGGVHGMCGYYAAVAALRSLNASAPPVDRPATPPSLPLNSPLIKRTR